MAAYYNNHHFITEEEKVTERRHWIPFCNTTMKSQNDKLIDVYSDLKRERDNNLAGMMVLLKIMITFNALSMWTWLLMHEETKDKHSH